jgi:hypothetical protein
MRYSSPLSEMTKPLPGGQAKSSPEQPVQRTTFRLAVSANIECGVIYELVLVTTRIRVLRELGFTTPALRELEQVVDGAEHGPFSSDLFETAQQVDL